MGDVESEWNGEDWDKERLAEFVREKPGRCVVVIDGYAIDVTKYLGEHVRFSLFSKLDHPVTYSCC